MSDHVDIKRPPEKAAALLALTVELYKANRPFPTRQAAAIALGCSKFTIDAALSTRLDEGYLTQIVTETGNIQARHGIIRKRFYIPSQDLISVAEHAKWRG